MNNVSFNREQFNDTIKNRLVYLISNSIYPSKKVDYNRAKKEDYQQSKKVNYPKPNNLI